jgi:homoserine O-succinyltransferase/O-acetyltransferase
MPVSLDAPHTGHPFIPSYFAEPFTRERPLDICVVNLMESKRGTEKQIWRVLEKSGIPIRLALVTADDKNNSKTEEMEHIGKFYRPFDTVCVPGQRFDGLIVTGVNPRAENIKDEKFWNNITRVFDWADTNVRSSLFLCSGGQASLLHHYGIERQQQPQKTFGVFVHDKISDSTGILAGAPNSLSLPVSRWNEIAEVDVRKHGKLEVVLTSREAGVSLVVEPGRSHDGRIFPQRVVLLGHPEYGPERLWKEWDRDLKKGRQIQPPKNYFPNDNSKLPPNEIVETWGEARVIYTNWVKSIQETRTPYDLGATPTPYKQTPSFVEARS